MADGLSDYGAGMAKQASETGRNAINAFDPRATGAAQKAGYNQLYGQQTGTISDLTGKYAEAIASNPAMTEYLTQANKMFGVPELSRQATYLRGQVAQALPSAYQRSRGFDVTQAQAENMANQSLKFLQPQASQAEANYLAAADLANKYVQQGLAQTQLNLLPIQYQTSAINDAMARQSTGYTQANQSEFQGLIDKMNAGVTLSKAEMDRANQLASLQNAYEVAKMQTQADIAKAQIGQQFQTLSPGQTLVNTLRGTTVRAR